MKWNAKEQTWKKESKPPEGKPDGWELDQARRAGYTQAVEDAIYRLEECKGYTVDFNRHMDLAINEIKALLSRGSR